MNISDTAQGRSLTRRPFWDRAIAAAGAGYVLLVGVGNDLNVRGTSQAAHPTGRQVLADTAHQAGSTAATVGFVLEIAGFVGFLLFLGYLTALAVRTHRSGRAGAGDGRAGVTAAATAVLAGLTMLAVKLASGAPMVALALDRQQLSPRLAQVLNDMNGAAFVLSWLPFAVLVGGMAVMVRQAGLAGRPTAYAGLLFAVAGCVLAVIGLHDVTAANPVAFLLSLLWLLVVSIRLAARRTDVVPAGEPTVVEHSMVLPSSPGASRATV